MISILSKTLFLIGLLFIGLFLYSLMKDKNRLASLFALICLSISIYSIGYGMELRSDNLEQIRFFMKMKYFGTSFMAALWISFCYKFNFGKSPSFKLYVLIFAIPMFSLFVSATDEYLHFLYDDVSLVQYKDFVIVKIVKGPWYYVGGIFYNYFSFLFGLVTFFKCFRDNRYKVKSSCFWLFIGSICPWVTNIIYLTGIVPYGIDVSPFGFVLLVICCYMALFKYGFLELKETIRDVTFSEIKAGIIVIDNKKRLIDFNSEAKEIFSWLDKRKIGRDFYDFQDGRRILEQQSSPFEIQVGKCGTMKYYEFSETILKERNKDLGQVYFIHDITERKELIEKLNYMANYDSQTDMFNRRKLIEESKKQLQYARENHNQFAALIIDIDDFKSINDKYGHFAGDEALIGVSEVFKNNINEQSIVGRYGGEEFLIVMYNCNEKEVLNFAEDIRKHVSNSNVLYNGEKISVTISIGIALVEWTNNFNINEVINFADIALYEAKNNGKNQSVLNKY